MALRFRKRLRHRCEKQASHGCTCSLEERLNATTLDQAQPGSTVEVCCVTGNGRIVRRLMEMGFVPGTPVKVLRKAPFADPIEYEIRGYYVSLRRHEAALVRIQPLSQPVSDDTRHTEKAEAV